MVVWCGYVGVIVEEVIGFVVVVFWYWMLCVGDL